MTDLFSTKGEGVGRRARGRVDAIIMTARPDRIMPIRYATRTLVGSLLYYTILKEHETNDLCTVWKWTNRQSKALLVRSCERDENQSSINTRTNRQFSMMYAILSPMYIRMYEQGDLGMNERTCTHSCTWLCLFLSRCLPRKIRFSYTTVADDSHFQFPCNLIHSFVCARLHFFYGRRRYSNSWHMVHIR